MDNSFSLEYLIKQLATKVIAQSTKSRLEQFIVVLNQRIVDVAELRKLAAFGIPDDIKGLRSLCWKLMMGYLPADRSRWSEIIANNNQVYRGFCDDLLKSRLTTDQLQEIDAANEEHEKVNHPLSKQKSSTWSVFFKDQQIWEEVEKDTIRTRAEFSFFVSPTQTPNQYPVHFRTQVRRERNAAKDFEHRHYDVLTRMLFVYAKLNPAVRYVQGMNEILAPFYYTFYSDCNEVMLQSVESDAFFCFTHFMADAKDCFLRSQDEYRDGIQCKMRSLNKFLQEYDWDLWNHLEKLKIHPQFYSLRWIMLYLTQEFELHQVFRIWDSLLSKEDKNQYLLYLCLGILSSMKQQLMNEDFTDVMESFGKISELDVDQILNIANGIYTRNA